MPPDLSALWPVYPDTIWSRYAYDGKRRLVRVDYPEVELMLDYCQGTSAIYPSYDRFGRIVDQFWAGYGSTGDVDCFKFGHDYAGNRLYRDIDASIYAADTKDQAYTYDCSHRMATFAQGVLSGMNISRTPVAQQDWNLDAPLARCDTEGDRCLCEFGPAASAMRFRGELPGVNSAAGSD